MMRFRSSSLQVLASTVLLVALPAPLPAQSCSGCRGSGADSGISGNDQCSDEQTWVFITIDILVKKGVCAFVPEYPIGGGDCVASPCKVNVHRTWDLETSVDLDFCVQFPSEQLCLEPKPHPNPDDEDYRTTPISCSGAPVIFSIAVQSCVSETKETAEGSCTTCD